jgi:hypothetical protein
MELQVVRWPNMAASDTGRIGSSFCKMIPEQMESLGARRNARTKRKGIDPGRRQKALRKQKTCSR